MNWTAIGATGEVLGALAVFLTLIYLAIQIRTSTKVAKSTVRQHITETIMRVGESVTSNTELAHAWMEQYDGEVEPHKELQLQGFAYSTMRLYENIQFQMNNGMLTPEEWRGFEGNLKALLALQYFRRYCLQNCAERLPTTVLSCRVGVPNRRTRPPVTTPPLSVASKQR